MLVLITSIYIVYLVSINNKYRGCERILLVDQPLFMQIMKFLQILQWNAVLLSTVADVDSLQSLNKRTL